MYVFWSSSHRFFFFVYSSHILSFSIPLSPASHVGANILFDLSSSKEAKLSGSRSSSLASSLQGRTESSRYPLQFQPSAFDEGAPSTLSYSSLLSHELTSTGVAPISSRPELVRSPHGLVRCLSSIYICVCRFLLSSIFLIF